MKVFPLGLLIYADIVFKTNVLFGSYFFQLIIYKQDKVNNANSAFIFLIDLLIGQGCCSFGLGVVMVVQVVTINNSKVDSQMR